VYSAALASRKRVTSGDTFASLVVYVPATFVAGKSVTVGGASDHLYNALFVGVGDVLGVVCAIVGAEICKVFHNLLRFLVCDVWQLL
jgi:hypothetical protein